MCKQYQQQQHLYQGPLKNQLKKNANIFVLINTSNVFLLVHQVITNVKVNVAEIISNVSILVIQEWEISSFQLKSGLGLIWSKPSTLLRIDSRININRTYHRGANNHNNVEPRTMRRSLYR